MSWRQIRFRLATLASQTSTRTGRSDLPGSWFFFAILFSYFVFVIVASATVRLMTRRCRIVLEKANRLVRSSCYHSDCFGRWLRDVSLPPLLKSGG